MGGKRRATPPPHVGGGGHRVYFVVEFSKSVFAPHGTGGADRERGALTLVILRVFELHASVRTVGEGSRASCGERAANRLRDSSSE